MYYKSALVLKVFQSCIGQRESCEEKGCTNNGIAFPPFMVSIEFDDE